MQGEEGTCGPPLFEFATPRHRCRMLAAGVDESKLTMGCSSPDQSVTTTSWLQHRSSVSRACVRDGSHRPVDKTTKLLSKILRDILYLLQT